MTFSEEELIAILENHFANEATKVVSTEKVVQVHTEVAQVPTEDKLFEVDPQAIDQGLFQKKWEELPKKKKGSRQGKTCQIISEAFEEVKNNPEKYSGKFYTMMPKKEWDDDKTVAELEGLACELGDHNADWVEQALEWAQRICNGESWEAVCNNPDTANCYRLVVWKNGYARIVGGSSNNCHGYTASDVYSRNFYLNDCIEDTVPLVVLYKK